MVEGDEKELDKVKKLLDDEGIDKAILYLEVSLRKLKSKVWVTGPGNRKLKKIEEVNKTKEINSSIIIDELVYENIPFRGKYNWDEANMYCQQKNGTWRLPTQAELYKITNRKGLEASNGEVIFVRKEFLENMKSASWYWTNNVRVDKFISLVSFRINGVFVAYKTDTHSVLCVSEQ